MHVEEMKISKFFDMNISILFMSFVVFVTSGKNQKDLEVEYYEKLIENAFNEMKTFKGREDNSDYFKNLNETKEIEEYGSFDFIVVGAGNTGSVVSSRLSEIEGFEVLLLEAGDWNDDLTDISFMSNILQYSNRNWGYFTTPQNNGCLNSKDNKCPYPSGKVVGGTSTIGYADYIRGNKADFDYWESLGNPGWSYEDVLHYFKKVENFEYDEIDLKQRGFAGPVNIGYTIPKPDFSLAEDTASAVGMKTIGDYNAKQEIAVSRIQKSTNRGRKQNGATSYVRSSSSRHNLNVTLNAFVMKILIEETTKSAHGVQFIKNGKLYKGVARKEVILSAGTFNTAQLLMLSGIGPKNELTEHGISVIIDSPIGEHVRDSNFFQLRFETNISPPTKPFREHIREYLNGEGYLTNFENTVAITFLDTKNSTSRVPNVELLHYDPSPISKQIPPYNNPSKYGIDHMKKFDPRKDVYLNIFVSKPKSTGTIKLQSNSPIDFPLIDIGLFKDPEDMEVMYEGIKFVLELSNTEAAQKIAPKPIEFESCSKYELGSKDYWFCAMKYATLPGFHICSSAKMGPETDPHAVVDNNLRVYGVNNLRVADCSILPTTLSGHAMPIAYVIGEKLADILKDKYAVN